MTSSVYFVFWNWSRRLARLTALLGGYLIISVSANGDCREIAIEGQQTLSLGTLRTLPGATGFLELDPQQGIAVSAEGAVHAGPYGAATVDITGPVGAEVTLLLEAQKVSDHDARYLDLSELMVRSEGLNRRMPVEDGDITINLSGRGDAQNRTRKRIFVGAVMRFRAADEQQQAQYRLAVACIRVR